MSIINEKLTKKEKFIYKIKLIIRKTLEQKHNVILLIKIRIRVLIIK